MSNALPIGELVTWELRDLEDRLVASGSSTNIITRVGARMYAERAVGVAGAPDAPTGMKLGTGTTAPAASGAGAALVTYLADSHQAFDAGFPSSESRVDGRRITYKVTFAAGKATTASPINEAVIVNETLTDATSAEAATLARVLLTGVTSKPVDQSLILTWAHDLGATT